MELSIIVPAYNEEKRINPFLRDLLCYSKQHFRDYEIIIVNDGSKDNTVGVVSRLIKREKESRARMISYSENKGKGYAVRKGVLESKGENMIFIDADGSIAPDQIPLMLEKLKKYDVVVGSRRIRGADVDASGFRVFIGTMFNYYVNLLYRIDVWDNLCGFKGFRKKAAKDLFRDLISRRWIFDVELFYKIRKKGYKMHELPIRWVHKEDTKIRPLDPLKMAWQLLALRMRLLRN